MTVTTNLGLTTYSSESGSATTHLTFRTALAGTGVSNMSIIDTFCGAVSASVVSLKTNSFITVPASQISTNYYEATVSSLTGYYTNMPIHLKLNTSISGSATLNVNGYGVRNLMKVDTSGCLVNLATGDLTINKINPFVYNGTYWVLAGQGSSGSSTSGSGGISVSGSVIDMGVVRFSGTGGSTVMSSGVTIDNTGNLSLNGNQIQNYAEKVVTTSSSQVYNIDWSAANMFEITMSGSVTFTFSNLAAGRSITTLLIQDVSGSRRATWPTVKWSSGSTPILSTSASAIDVITFLTRSNGTTVLGFPAGMDMR
jgi:hypothetical protein